MPNRKPMLDKQQFESIFALVEHFRQNKVPGINSTLGEICPHLDGNLKLEPDPIGSGAKGIFRTLVMH